MRVLDASVVTDAVAVNGPSGRQARRLLEQERVLHAPALLGAEVTSALQTMVIRGTLRPADARAAASRAARIRRRSYPFEPLLERVWELRDNVTVYDGWYVALAESLDAPLVTGDERLLAAPGPRCRMLSPAEALDEG